MRAAAALAFPPPALRGTPARHGSAAWPKGWPPGSTSAIRHGVEATFPYVDWWTVDEQQDRRRVHLDSIGLRETGRRDMLFHCV